MPVTEQGWFTGSVVQNGFTLFVLITKKVSQITSFNYETFKILVSDSFYVA